MSGYQEEKQKAIEKNLSNREKIFRKYPENTNPGIFDGRGEGFAREMRAEQKRFMAELKEVNAKYGKQTGN